jgi:hypothetical protein
MGDSLETSDGGQSDRQTGGRELREEAKDARETRRETAELPGVRIPVLGEFQNLKYNFNLYTVRYLDPHPDPATQIYADASRSGSETL